jgi:hypothetical protein
LTVALNKEIGGNMFKKSLLLLLSVLIISGVSFAQEEAEAVSEGPALSLEDVQICSSIEDRQPEGTGTVFSDDLEKIYCFTKVIGAEDTTSVNHVWYMGDKQIISVNLPIKAASWRTWSSKMLDMGLGKGYVEIVSEGGDILGKVEFEIKAAGEEASGEAEETEEMEAEEEEAGEMEKAEGMETEKEEAEETKEIEKTEEAGKACEKEKAE